MQCSHDGGVSECELTGDLQVDQDVALKLSCQALKLRNYKTGVLGHGVSEEQGAVL